MSLGSLLSPFLSGRFTQFYCNMLNTRILPVFGVVDIFQINKINKYIVLKVVERLQQDKYNQATTKLAFHSNETSKDKLSKI